MNRNDNNDYNPADDDNQGVVQLMAQGELASPGIPQDGGLDPVKAQGPEPEKAEVNDSDANGISDELLTEEKVEAGDADETDDQ